MSQLIQSWTTPIDPGGGAPGRIYTSPQVGAGWTHLSAIFNANMGWSGYFRIDPGEASANWFNRYPQPASPFTESDPNQSYTSSASDAMLIGTNNDSAGLVVSVELYGDSTGPCSAGSEMKPGSPTYFTYQTSDVASVLPGNLGLILWGLMGLPLTPQYTADFCASAPPTDFPTAQDWVKLAFPPIALISGTYKRFANSIIAQKWDDLCQCRSPGSYTPPAPISPPVGWTGPPEGPTCSSFQDICNQLSVVWQSLQALSQVQYTSAPASVHSYAEWTVHSGLVGSGELALGSQAIAIKVRIDQDQAGLGELAGDPAYLLGRGYIVPITVEGAYHQRTRLVYNPQLYHLPPFTSRIGYWFNQGISASIIELTAGP